MSQASLPVLMYHHVSDSPGLVTLSPEHFRAQMEWIAGQGYCAINTGQLEMFLRGEWSHPRPVMITFDDGYFDNYHWAYPILRRLGLHAVLFGITGLMGEGAPRHTSEQGTLGVLPNHGQCKELIATGRADEAMIRWSEAERMLADGTMEIHSHTHSHSRWDALCAGAQEKRDRLAEDLDLSRRALTARLGNASGHLCWPQGYFDSDYQDVARQAGFTHLYTTQPGSVVPGSDAFSLPRIVTKDKSARWLGSRLFVYGSPVLTRLYGWLRRG